MLPRLQSSMIDHVVYYSVFSQEEDHDKSTPEQKEEPLPDEDHFEHAEETKT